jgi:hypothetical protein
VPANVIYSPWATTSFANSAVCTSPTFDEDAICEGTPDSCTLIEDSFKCNIETPGCRWYSLEPCNPRIGQEAITVFNPAIMKFYECTMTVQSIDTMYQEYWVKVVAESLEASGLPEYAFARENEYWYLNPLVGIGLSDPIVFNEVRNGVQTYSNTVLIQNQAAPESGVHLEMFIAGQDFRPGMGESGTCFNPVNGDMSNYLVLSDDDSASRCDMPRTFAQRQENVWDTFCYHAVQGAYNTRRLAGRADAEGYVGIPKFRNEFGILDSYALLGDYAYDEEGWCPASFADLAGNVLSPGSDVSFTLKLMVPEPCTGMFSDGAIVIYGEAI